MSRDRFGLAYPDQRTLSGPTADFHSHTTASDGRSSPRVAIQNAAERHLTALAITDHDGVKAVRECARIGAELGVEVIPGLEVTTFYKGTETHILGHLVDIDSPVLAALTARQTQSRLDALMQMLDNLTRAGMPIAFEEVVAHLPDPTSTFFARPHIAEALRAKGTIATIEEAFGDRFLGSGGPHYVQSSTMTVEEAISAIHAAGGHATVAHPGSWRKGEDLSLDDLRQFKEWGLDGVEVLHIRHDETQRAKFWDWHLQLELFPTAGADCHGTFYDPIKMGSVKAPYEWLEAMRLL